MLALGVYAKGCQSSVCLAQEAPDALSISSSGGLEVLQPLLGDDQLLHLPLPGHHPILLVPQTGLPAICVELAGQDLGTTVLQSFPLPLEVNLMTVEAGLTGAQDLELTAVGDVVHLFPLLQLPLPLLQLPLSLL
jgi:hypothetical protein